ncbi:hypothetical protein AgCh_016906 [Apium graveolens]
MTSMASLLGSSKAVMEGSLQHSGSTRLSTGSCNRVTVARSVLNVRAQQLSFETETSRRAVLGVVAAAARAKDSAKDIENVKELIDKKAWPYVQNDLRSKAEYLRYDLNTAISAKPKHEKKLLKELTRKLFQVINDLDYAAKTKSTPKAEKTYAETVTALNDVLAKLG